MGPRTGSVLCFIRSLISTNHLREQYVYLNKLFTVYAYVLFSEHQPNYTEAFFCQTFICNSMKLTVTQVKVKAKQTAWVQVSYYCHRSWVWICAEGTDHAVEVVRSGGKGQTSLGAHR